MQSRDDSRTRGRSNQLHERISRRELLRRTGVGAAVLGASGVLAACVGSGTEGQGGGESPGQEARRRGGRLRTGHVGGGTAETLDPRGGLSNIDVARNFQLYERLTDFKGPRGELVMTLAESIEPANSEGTEWIIRLKSDVEWHNGKTLGADDVIFSFRTILDPANELGGRSNLAFIDPQGMSADDERTVRLKFIQPIANAAPSFGGRLVPIVQDGFTDFDNPVGTGPFKFKSWTPGERSLFERFENYHETGRPFVDELEMINIVDPTARLNALRSGQIDVMEGIELADAVALENDPTIEILNCQSGAFIPLVMHMDNDPFDDVRVRQAFKLLVDREQMIDQVFQGFGSVGNDLFSPFDPLYDSSIPQRSYDPEQAESLLKAAGREGLTVELHTARVQPGYVESAQAFAEQARAAGVTVNVKVGPADSYFSDVYLNVPFFQTNWGYWPLDEMIALSAFSEASYNETGFSNERFDALWEEARGTLDESRRQDMYGELQRIQWDEGGFIIWGFPNLVDAHRASVTGFECSPARPLGFYNFKEITVG